jgi:hypothetical protein
MKKILVVVMSLSLLCTACSTAWVGTLDSILAVAAPALVNILQIVAIADGKPMNGSLSTKIAADAAVLKALASDFAKASSGSASGLCQQLQTALSVYQSDQQLVLQAAQVSDPNTQTKITLLVGLVVGTVDAIASVIPSCQNPVASRSMKAAPPYSLSTFATRYNAILLKPTGNSSVDAATPKLKLHQHSKLFRSLTFGRMQ